MHPAHSFSTEPHPAPKPDAMGEAADDPTIPLDAAAYLQRLLAAPRPGADRVLAFHDHRVGGICTDPRLLLAPLDDHLCHRGDGVFESIRYRQRRLFQLDLHLARLRRSADAIRLAPPCPWDDLRDRIIAVARAGGQDEGGIRVLVGRGPGGFGISPAECPQSSLYIIAWRQTAPPEAWFAAGLDAFRSAMPAHLGPLSGVKHANYLPNVLMMDEARQRGMDVPLTFDAQGRLSESAIANVALVDAAGTLAAPEGAGALPGTTLHRIMDLASSFMPATRRPITEADILSAREFLILGTVYECASLVRYEGAPIGTGRPGPVAARLREMLRRSLLADGTPF